MKYLVLIYLAGIINLVGQTEEIKKRAEDNLKFSSQQYRHMLNALSDTNEFPRSVNEEGTKSLVPSSDWTSGFFPGSLWYLI